ncbi:MFS transporter [Methylocystis sp.]|uniref:MFS transporter n=1 Tax=Methylocystis sp. TaxID=1911079 RepID=UPI003D105092
MMRSRHAALNTHEASQTERVSPEKSVHGAVRRAPGTGADFRREQARRRVLAITALIVAGESVFLLPFVVARVFRPTLLDVFQITNLQLGAAYSVYGVVAVAAYFFGGLLADRLPARAMLAVALASTAAGGLVLMTLPSPSTLALLYGYWAITTIALFWAPLIRATREWGLNFSQSRAFGLLEGGRGALSAVMASIMVVLFAALLPEDSETASLAQRTESLRQITLLLTATTGGAALLIFLALPARKARRQEAMSISGVARVFAMPSVWLQAAIILCAYVGFKAIDDFSLYANQVIGLNEVDAARIGVASLWIRPFAAIGVGYLAERIGAPVMTIACFTLLAAGSFTLAAEALDAGMALAFVSAIVVSGIGIFGLRGLYFAIMQDGQIPLEHTGSAVGLASVIGYAPDIFMGPLMGYLLDEWPGATGHGYVFKVVACFAMLGLIASYVFARLADQIRLQAR